MTDTVATVDEWIQARAQYVYQPHGTRLVELARELAPHVTGWVTAPVFTDPARGRVVCYTQMCSSEMIREFFTRNTNIWLFDLTTHDDVIFIRGDWTWDVDFYHRAYAIPTNV